MRALEAALYQYGSLFLALLVAAAFGWATHLVAPAVLVGGFAAAVIFAVSGPGRRHFKTRAAVLAARSRQKAARPATRSRGSCEMPSRQTPADAPDRDEAPPLGRWRSSRGVHAALGVVLVAAWALRWLPYRDSSVPLGYDYGFYEAAMQTYAHGARPAWMESQFPPGLPLLHAVLEGVTGLSAHDHLVFLFPVLAAALALPVFVLVRHRIDAGAGLFAAALVTVSMTMFTAYEYLYEKHLLAVLLVLVMLHAVARRRWVLAGLLLGGVAVWHRPTFLWGAVAAVGMAAWDIGWTRRWRPWTRMAAVAVAAFLPAWLLLPETFLELGLRVAEQTGAALSTDAAGGTGTFFDWDRYLFVAAAYLALAIATLGIRPFLGPVRILGVVAAAWVVLALPLHNRFLVMLDAAAVVLAAGGLWALARPKWRAGLAAAIVVLAAVPTVQEALEPAPTFRFVTAAEMDDIAWMGQNLPADATIVASNLQAPYVLAVADRETFGPGLFDDPADRGQWDAAMHNASTLAAHLSGYGQDVYVFQGRSVGFVAHLMPSDAFTVVRQTSASTVWHLEAP